MSDFPTIDVSELHSRAADLDDFCREWGVFLLTGHGLDGQQLLSQSRGFFTKPTEEKQKIQRTRDNPWGFYDAELTKNTPDWKEIFDYGLSDGEHWVPQWPANQPSFQAAVTDFYTASHALSLTVLDAICANLGLTPGSLYDVFEPEHTSFLRINYYPICPNPELPEGLATPSEGHLGVNHHTDSGVLTILLQDDQSGLEVLKDGKWHLVPSMPGALAVNLGDVLQVWSNNRYVAPVHRVRANADHDRLSAPYFLNPAYSANYAPLDSIVSEANPAKYKAINWGEFRRLRVDGDFADYGSEVQISDYLI